MEKPIIYHFVILSDSEYGYQVWISAFYNRKKYNFEAFIDNYDFNDSINSLVISEINNYERYYGDIK